METFKEHLVKLDNLLSTKKVLKTEQDIINFTEFLKSSAQVTESLYKDDFNNILSYYNIPQKMTFIQKKAEDTQNLCDSFFIENGKIIIEINQEKAQFPIYDIHQFISNIFEVHKKDIIYFILLGYCLEESRFNQIQLYSLSLYLQIS